VEEDSDLPRIKVRTKRYALQGSRYGRLYRPLPNNLHMAMFVCQLMEAGRRVGDVDMVVQICVSVIVYINYNIN